MPNQQTSGVGILDGETRRVSACHSLAESERSRLFFLDAELLFAHPHLHGEVALLAAQVIARGVSCSYFQEAAAFVHSGVQGLFQTSQLWVATGPSVRPWWPHVGRCGANAAPGYRAAWCAMAEALVVLVVAVVSNELP